MSPSYASEQAFHQMSQKTGVVIPVYLPEEVDTKRGEHLLRDTVYLFSQMVSDKAAICLSVDGEAFGADVAKRMSQEFSVSYYVNPENRGKLNAVRKGMCQLLENEALTYLTIVDQDGDHFANELLNFIRAAEHIKVSKNTNKLLVLGRRISRHRPMGFLRGELEELCDRILLDALMYHAVVEEQPLPLEYVLSFDEFPDFHSGYKLFSRATATDVFQHAPKPMGLSETCYYRHACEAVMVVEAICASAYFGVVNRSTFNEQPISTFGLYNRIQMAANKMIWPCKRLGIPVPFVRQWLSNHIPRLLLHTLAPEGKEELEQIRQLVIRTLADDEEAEIKPLFQPLFV